MRRLTLVLALALLATPIASAGKEEAPEVVSPRDQKDPTGDLLAAWLEHHPEGLKVSFKVAALGRHEVHRHYAFTFELDGQTHSPALGFDRDGRLRTDSGANAKAWGSPRLAARVDDTLLEPTVVRGEPAYLSAVVPWGLYEGLQPGATLTPVGAAASLYDGRVRAWLTPYDSAPAQQSGFVIASRSAVPVVDLPIVVPAWVLPTILVGTTLLGLGVGGVLGWRTRPQETRTRKAAAAPLPPPPPPGKRFRKDPRGLARSR